MRFSKSILFQLKLKIYNTKNKKVLKTNGYKYFIDNQI